MALTRSRIWKYVLIGIISVLIVTLWPRNRQPEEIEIHPRDYNAIVADGAIRAVTEYNSLSFYVDADSIAGFHYEVLEAFARDKGLTAEITPEMSFERRVQELDRGVYDVIAYGIPATSEWRDSLLLTTPIIRNRQILVQRVPGTDSTGYIRSQIDLAGKTLNVESGSPSILRIRNLAEEIGDTIYVNEIARYGPEQLIAMVAYGDIDYAVAEESIARTSADSLPQLDINTGISFTQFYSWGVNRQSPVLLDTLNSWLQRFIESEEYTRLYRKYYNTNP